METLAAVIDRLEEGLPAADAVGWAVRLLRTLEPLHDRGGAHGAIGAHAVEVASADPTSAAELRMPRDVPAKPIFQSPERTLGGSTSQADDTWASAVTLYVLLTAQPPFPGDNGDEVRERVNSGTPAPLAVFDVGDDDLQAVLDKALARDRQDRIASSKGLREALERWLVRTNQPVPRQPLRHEQNEAHDRAQRAALESPSEPEQPEPASSEPPLPKSVPPPLPKSAPPLPKSAPPLPKPAPPKSVPPPLPKSVPPPLPGSSPPRGKPPGSAPPKSVPPPLPKSVPPPLPKPAPPASGPAAPGSAKSVPPALPGTGVAAIPGPSALPQMVPPPPAPERKRNQVDSEPPPPPARMIPPPVDSEPSVLMRAPPPPPPPDGTSYASEPPSRGFSSAPPRSPSFFPQSEPPPAPDPVPVGALPRATPPPPVAASQRRPGSRSAAPLPPVKPPPKKGAPVGAPATPSRPPATEPPASHPPASYPPASRPPRSGAVASDPVPSSAPVAKAMPEEAKRSEDAGTSASAPPAGEPAKTALVAALPDGEGRTVRMALKDLLAPKPAAKGGKAPGFRSAPAPAGIDAPTVRIALEELAPHEPPDLPPPSDSVLPDDPDDIDIDVDGEAERPGARDAPPRSPSAKPRSEPPVVPAKALSSSRPPPAAPPRKAAAPARAPMPSRPGARRESGTLRFIGWGLVVGLVAAIVVILFFGPAPPPTHTPAPGDAPKPDGAAPDAPGGDAASAEGGATGPATPAAAEACIVTMFPEGTFVPESVEPRKLTSMCAEPDARRGGTLIRESVVRAGSGRPVTTAMQEWAILGWYELAAFSVVRARCCPDPVPLALPPPPAACEPLEASLGDLGESAKAGADDATLGAALNRFTEAVHCITRAGAGHVYGMHPVPMGGQDTAFKKTLARAVGRQEVR